MPRNSQERVRSSSLLAFCKARHHRGLCAGSNPRIRRSRNIYARTRCPGSACKLDLSRHLDSAIRADGEVPVRESLHGRDTMWCPQADPAGCPPWKLLGPDAVEFEDPLARARSFEPIKKLRSRVALVVVRRSPSALRSDGIIGRHNPVERVGQRQIVLPRMGI